LTVKRLYKPEYLYNDGDFLKNAAVLTEDGVILETGDAENLAAVYPEAEILNWDGLVMLPGTVNVHNHCFQSILRGLSCDKPFLEWRDNALYRFSPRFGKKEIYGAARFAFAEMMKYGVTTVCDFFYLHGFGAESDEMIVKAAADVGIRLVLARTMYDWCGAPPCYVETVDEAVKNTKLLAERYGSGDMVTVLPAPHSLHAASVEMVKAGHALAKELGVCFHIHVAEEPFEVEQVKAEHGGLTPIELLDKIGVVDDSMVIIHGVWLKKSEIDRLGEAGGKLAYCPSSNMFLADGITDIPRMMKKGVLIGLGSDGACSNNRISVFEEMRMVAILQKAATCDAMCVNYRQAFDMGTKNGGQLLGLPVGEIKKGMKADFVGIDASDMSMQPISASGEQILPNIVYSMQPQAIKKVVVDDRMTVDGGRLVSVPEEVIVRDVGEILKTIGA